MKSLLKIGEKHSTAMMFFIFSCISIIFAIKDGNEKWICIALFTFLYAFLAYRIKVLSVKEGIREYIIDDNIGFILYFLLDWGSFAIWMVSVIFLFKENMFNFLFLKICISSYIIVFTIWVGRAFIKKIKDKKTIKIKLTFQTK